MKDSELSVLSKKHQSTYKQENSKENLRNFFPHSFKSF